MTDPEPGPDEIHFPVGVSTSQHTKGAAERARLMELLDRHAGSLWSMALFFFDDLDRAESVVAELLVDAAVEPYTMSQADIRRDLSRRMYLTSRRLSMRRGPPAGTLLRPDEDATGSVTHVLLTTVTEQERAAIALCWLGEHSYQEASELMSLPARDVLNVLWTGLQALESMGHPIDAVSRSSRAQVEESAELSPAMAGGWR